MFPWVIPHSTADYLRVTHQFAANLSSCPNKPARLACLRRIANVRSEPESNSPYSNYFITLSSNDLLMQEIVTNCNFGSFELFKFILHQLCLFFLNCFCYPYFKELFNLLFINYSIKKKNVNTF